MSTVLFPYRNNNVNTCDNLYVASMLATVFPKYVCCTCHIQILDYAVTLRKPAVITATDQRHVVLGSHLVMNSNTMIVPQLRFKLNTFRTQGRNAALSTNLFSLISPFLISSPQKISSKEYKL